ncbi:MAG TPA: peptidylprolyl isomerase [Actinomycetota bacterium]|nr:peptidylprolyl isomerase [Actinomycetota bacterium]
MARTKARERQLRQLAERRMAERRRRRRQRLMAGVVGGIVALAGLFFAARAFLGGEENTDVDQTANPKQTASPTPLGGVACGGAVPVDAGKKKPTFDKPPEMQIDLNKSYRVAMTTSCGEISLELFDDKSPKTVNNFLFLVKKGFYDGTTFHRIIKGFMNQGGDPEGTGRGGPGYQFEDEVDNGLKFDQVGLLAMANSGPNTNGSQFFITTGDASHLNGKHTIFGKVIGGMEVVDALNALETDQSDKPTQTAYIETITIIQK